MSKPESPWVTLWQAWRRSWKRDLLAYPLVLLLTTLGMTALHGRDWHLGVGMIVSLLLIGAVAWVVGLWLVDRLFGPRSGSGWEKP
jgi:hypothetical protein